MFTVFGLNLAKLRILSHYGINGIVCVHILVLTITALSSAVRINVHPGAQSSVDSKSHQPWRQCKNMACVPIP